MKRSPPKKHAPQGEYKITLAKAEEISGVTRKSIQHWGTKNPNLMIQVGKFWLLNETELRRIMEARKVLKGE
jgi:hypothetical protein